MGSYPRLRLVLIALCSSIGSLCIRPDAGNAAPIVTLDFEELRTVSAETDLSVGQVYIHDGVRLTALPAPPPAEPRTELVYAGTLSPSFAGSTMLFQHIDSAEIVLDRVDGGRFNLRSIDLAELPNFDQSGRPIGAGSFDVTFTGIRANGTEITKTVTVDRFPTIDTYTFPGFADLTSIHWFQGPGGLLPGFGDHQFDNVSLLFIPEPATLWLLVWGNVMLETWCQVRRRAGKHASRSASE
jgi:hypothetical protein